MTTSQRPTEAPQAPEQPAQPTRPGVREVLGELLLTAGVLVVLFLVWQLWWTDVVAQRGYQQTRYELQEQWRSEPSGKAPKLPGKAFGLLYVPAMRSAWGVPIVQGTAEDDLRRGVGHHVRTALPGQVGNMVLAGHRTTYGAPFGTIDQLAKGDAVIVETRRGWFEYSLDRSAIIEPDESWILDPQPGQDVFGPATKRLITIYACHPKFTAAQRLVWFGHLVAKTDRSDGAPPAIRAVDSPAGR